MKLYYKSGSCSLSPHIALCESGLPFELVVVDLANKKLSNGDDFYKVNPKGQVPALTMDENGELLTEGAAIVQYIADRATTSIAPANGTVERARLQEWLNFIATEMHKGFSPIYKADTPESYKETCIANWKKKLDMLEQHFAKNNWLLKDFSVADGYLFTVLTWAPRAKIDVAIGWPKLGAFMDRMRARPAVQKALQAEGLMPKAA